VEANSVLHEAEEMEASKRDFYRASMIIVFSGRIALDSRDAAIPQHPNHDHKSSTSTRSVQQRTYDEDQKRTQQDQQS